jgi:Skp family chaperone for outer membrane proteins
MWKKVYEVLSRLFALTQKVEKHDKEIADLREEMRNLTAIAQKIAFELQRLNEREMHEREKLELRLENQLLRFERRLPSGKKESSDKDMD